MAWELIVLQLHLLFYLHLLLPIVKKNKFIDYLRVSVNERVSKYHHIVWLHTIKTILSPVINNIAITHSTVYKDEANLDY